MSFNLALSHMAKSYGDCSVVNGVDIIFEAGRVHALLGENGAGKSTLMKLAFGLIEPDIGEIQLDQKKIHLSSPIDAIRLGIGMVQQHFTLVETLSVIDNIMLGAEIVDSLGTISRKKAIQRIESVLPSESLRVEWNRTVETLPVGDKQKVEILKSLYHDSKFLILDEPTAVLSPLEIDELLKVIGDLRKSGRTVVMITHKLKEVFAVADRVHVMRQGRLVEQFDLDRQMSYAAFHQRAVRAMMGLSNSNLEISSLDKSLVPSSEQAHNTSSPVSVQSDVVLKVEELCTDEVPRLTNVNLEVRRGEILGVAGVSGAGQSELIEAIVGLRSFSGSIEALNVTVKPGAKTTRELRDQGLSLIPEDRIRQGLWPNQSAAINVALGAEEQFATQGMIDWQRWQAAVEPRLKEFDVRAVSYSTPVARLSGGNQQKLVFAREVLGREPKLFLIHHPTRGVDLVAMQIIHASIRKLAESGVGILLISSEVDELFELSHRIVVMRSGEVVGHLKNPSEFDREVVGRLMIGGLGADR